jgi:predicted amino acid racemase
MAAPRLQIDLDKVGHNARTLVRLLSARGIAVTGVTKATLGSPEVAGALVRAGVSTLGDSRIENIEAMRRAEIVAPMMLVRAPMLSQTSRVVANCGTSLNSEPTVIGELASAAEACGLRHGVVLMVELGDLREGILPVDVEDAVRAVRRFDNITLEGIGTNLACQSGIAPDDTNMAALSELAGSLEDTFGIALDIISGGNSANLEWALSGADLGRVNHLRLGESILLGRETLHRTAIPALHTDAFTLVAEVIEAKRKPTQPWGTVAQTAFGEHPIRRPAGDVVQTILAVGRQDVDPAGLSGGPSVAVIGASSDHLIVTTDERLAVGDELAFELNYSALVRAMTSPFVAKVFVQGSER